MSFGSIAENYDGLRPQAPRQAVDWLMPSECEVAVDVGAGTGLFTRTLIGRAAQVIAVEPDARMRAVLAERSPASASSRAAVSRSHSPTVPRTPCSSRRRGTGWIPNGRFRKSGGCFATAGASA